MASLAAPDPSRIRPPPTVRLGVIAWLRANLFDSVASTITTVVLALLIANAVSSLWLWLWLVVRGTWHPADIRTCIDGGGAC